MYHCQGSTKGLLGLPYDIRHKIYLCVLTTTRKNCITTDNADVGGPLRPNGNRHPSPRGRDCHWDLHIDPAILLTCHQINAEATKIPYSRTIFHFGVSCLVDRFADTISERNLDRIRRIQIAGKQVVSDSGPWQTAPLARSLTRMANLKTLAINCYVDPGIGNANGRHGGTGVNKITLLTSTLLRAHDKLRACRRLQDLGPGEVGVVLVSGKTHNDEELVDVGTIETMLKDRIEAEGRKYASRIANDEPYSGAPGLPVTDLG